jgi:peptide/nickel transport system ATP-binding protein
MRQRVAIAIAMLNNPDIIIADEPTTALDVTIQAQILSEMQKLCRERGTALIWVTHDLTVVAGLADRIYVMYAGSVVEQGPVDAVLDTPIHPYTDGLIRSIPSHNEPGRPLNQIPGATPPLDRMPRGCRFHPRCSRRTEGCLSEIALADFGGARKARCIHPLMGS